MSFSKIFSKETRETLRMFRPILGVYSAALGVIIGNQNPLNGNSDNKLLTSMALGSLCYKFPGVIIIPWFTTNNK